LIKVRLGKEKVLWLRWDDQKKLSEIEDLVDRLKNEDSAILVEGSNDEKSLRELGIDNEIIRVSETPKSLFKIAEYISQRWDKAIILTDWDSHGEKLSSKLHEVLQNCGVAPNDIYRRKFKFMLLKDIKDVESLSNLIENMKATEFSNQSY